MFSGVRAPPPSAISCPIRDRLLFSSIRMYAGSFSACVSIHARGPAARTARGAPGRLRLIDTVHGFPLSICSRKNSLSRYTWQHSCTSVVFSASSVLHSAVLISTVMGGMLSSVTRPSASSSFTRIRSKVTRPIASLPLSRRTCRTFRPIRKASCRPSTAASSSSASG